jgi:hypothetical protein
MDWEHSWQAPVAGALGGVVRALTLRLPAIEAASGVVVGGICAIYLGPLALPVIEKTLGAVVVEEASRVGLSGFIIGLGGIAVSGFVLDLWKRLRHDQKKGGK